jgi:hypothetical protein
MVATKILPGRVAGASGESPQQIGNRSVELSLAVRLGII